MMDPPYSGPKVESRAAGGSGAVVPPELRAQVEDPFRYGSRWVEIETPEGRTFQEVPLTWEDLFDPQEGDLVTHSIDHGNVISETKERLRSFFDSQQRNDVVVCDDVKMLWKDPALARVGPDIAVIPGVKDRKRYRKSFNEKQEGTRPVFVLEVISEATGEFDKNDKPKIYHRAKVKECFLLDQLTSPWELTGYRQDPKTRDYVAVAPDERGGLLSETLGVWFRIAPGGDDLIVEDAATGKVLRKPTEESRARAAAERQAAEATAACRREAEARAAAEAENEKLLAEIKRLRASQST